ncbi:hypothetical protein LOK49_LG07G02209 [Camellia lanceoleosa]|uniref:Uncharacterized protein n=1 Tax=Camellia lanceoleosa TaxID=1840588 RepID=A0ACC0H0U7_9ERIC|nr:hypothetical protein LOK49_LG07G02209 [Camellia lanceoleosa]
MARATVKIPINRLNSDEAVKYCGRQESVVDLIFGFLEEGDVSSDSSCNSSNSSNYGGSLDDMDVNDESADNNVNSVEEDKAFWESKDQLLQGALCRTTSIETKIRNATKEAMRELSLGGIACTCRRPTTKSCQNCLQREISDRLEGEHTYLEVLDNSNSKKKELRVVIELNFRAEFEMAKANEEYNRLICRLPEVFVGKAERLQALIKISCSAAKKCMKDKKMHMGPWRKHKYMQAKWFGECERTVPLILSGGFPGQLPKPRASMLTFDLIENLPVLKCTAVN